MDAPHFLLVIHYVIVPLVVKMTRLTNARSAPGRVFADKSIVHGVDHEDIFIHDIQPDMQRNVYVDDVQRIDHVLCVYIGNSKLCFPDASPLLASELVHLWRVRLNYKRYANVSIVCFGFSSPDDMFLLSYIETGAVKRLVLLNSEVHFSRTVDHVGFCWLIRDVYIVWHLSVRNKSIDEVSIC